MSTLKVNAISDVAGANGNAITLASNGKCAVTGSTITADTGKFTNLPNHNLIINGGMTVAQRGASSTSGGYKTVDRWQVSDNNTNVTITQAQHALTSSDTGPWAKGFRNSYHISLSAAGNSLDGSSLIELVYGIEAQDLANSGWDYTSTSSYITISFWFKCSTNQTFYGHLRTKDGTEQGYPFSFTASGNDTWTKITQSIPGNSNLQFDDDANLGCQLRIIPYMGANYTDSGRADKTWAAHTSGTYLPDMANTWITAGTSSFEFTGVQLEVSDYATEFEHLSYGDELLRCTRYYWRTLANNNEFFPNMGMADTDGNTVILNTQFPVRMRSAPTAIEQSGTASDYKIRRSSNKTCTSVPAFGHATRDQAVTNFVSSSHGWGDGSAVRCMGGATDAFLAWSAEL